MQDGYTDCSYAAKHRIKCFENHVEPVHSAPYRANSKTRELEKAETHKILAQQEIRPTLTKCATLIEYSLRKMNRCIYVSKTRK